MGLLALVTKLVGLAGVTVRGTCTTSYTVYGVAMTTLPCHEYPVARMGSPAASVPVVTGDE